MATVGPPTVWQRVHASDPGSVRLTLSVRAVGNLVAVLGVTLAATGALGLTGMPRTVVLILASVLTMIATFTAADPTARGRALTVVCLPVTMLATVTLSTLVDRQRVLSLVTYVVVMVVVVWARRFGPRAFACGMVAWIGYFIALFLQLSFAQLPYVLLALGVATAVLLVLGGAVAPMSPSRRLRRMVDALVARVHVARWDAARGRLDDEHALAAALLRANETAVLVDGQLAVPGAVRDPAAAPVVRAAVLRVELALAALLEAEAAGADHDDDRATELDTALGRVAAVIADDRAGRAVPDLPAERAPFTPGADLFGGFLPGSAVTVGAMFDPAPAGATPTGSRLSLTARQAIQIGVAGALTIVLGDLMSGQRWYWAVLACFLAFTGTATSAEITRKAGQRAVGTVVGVAVALPLLPLLGTAVPTAVITMLVALFVGFYFFRVSYTVLAVAVTVLVAELYALMGSFSEQILWLRVGETVLGAVVGAVVAVLVLPTPARRAESSARARLAEDLRDALTDVAAVVRGDASRVELHERLRVLDGDIHQLAVIGVPMLRREVPGTGVPRATVRRRLATWVTAAVRVRTVVHAVEDAVAGAGDARGLPGHPALARAVASVHALADGSVLGRPPDGDDGRDAGGDRLRELAALHGALVALHEIDGRSRPDAPAVAATPEAPAGRVTGTARGRDGAPIDAVVTLVDANGRQHGRARAVDGRYTLTLPGPGAWQLVSGAPAHAPRADRVVVDGGPRVVRHDITLDPRTPTLPFAGRRGPSTAPASSCPAPRVGPEHAHRPGTTDDPAGER